MGQKILLSCFLSLFFAGLFAQSQSKLDIALRHVEQKAESLELSSSDLEGLIVNYWYTNHKTGATYIYLNQAHDGIKVKNAIMTIALNKDNKVIHVASNFVSDLKSKIKSSQEAITPSRSVLKAAEYLGVTSPDYPKEIARSDKGVITYAATNFTNSDILVEKMYDLTDEGIKLTYQSTLDMKANADYWEIRIDASTGEFVNKNNLTVYCSHDKGKYTNHSNCAAHKISNVLSQSKTVEEAVAQSTGSYRVYPLPAESPNHGTHELVVNPGYVEASPFGWHDVDGVDGPEYTITRGNNVFAYTDKDDDNSPDPDIAQPDGGADLIFDYAHQIDIDPINSPDAAQVNLFYMNNMMHDLTYLVGFDEAAGNFQQTNYSGEGAGGDYVLAQAFDGFELAEPSLNNANFATPSDGGSGRMQMFLWNKTSGAVFVNSPSELSRFYEYAGTAPTSNWGAPIPTSIEPAISGNIELVNDGSLTSPTTGCKEIENDLTGKVALIDRGLCDFSIKAYNAQTKGAIAVIICNIAGVNGGDGEEFLNMAAGDNAQLVTIPPIFMKKSDCDAIKIALSNNVDVNITFQESADTDLNYLDGSFDNGVIAHEFAHGISNRLTGGPGLSSCLTNDEQMGEGWSDFFALVTTVEEGDKGEDARGIGTYANDESREGRGIRRFPYSTDMSINPQTYDDIKGTTAPHPLGEVWVAMLWDLYWNFVDLYGYDSDWTNLESGNNKAIRLVMEGMKLQACGPGFVEGRTGIFAADQLLFDGIHNCMIWETFARRGLGFFADGGSPDDRNDGTENFETRPTCLEELKIKKTATSFIEAGDEIIVTLTATNHIPQTLNGVVVTDEIPEGCTFVESSASMSGTVSGDIVSFDLGTMEYEDEIVITYTIMTPPDTKSTSLNYYDFEDGGEDWTVQREEGFTTWTVSFDDFKSGETSYRIREEEAENDHSLVSPSFNITGAKPALKFWHKYETQGGIDGGFIQISTDGGLTWQFTNSSDFIRRPYNTPIDYSTLAIPALEGFTGSSGGEFVDSYLDLSNYIGQDIQIRFRYGSDETITSNDLLNGGWFVDDVEIVDLISYKAKACISEETSTHGTCALETETIINSDATNSAEDVVDDYYGVKIAPNPAGDYVRILATSKVSELASVNITSMDGKLISTSKIKVGPTESIHTLDINALPSGFYIIKIQNGVNQYSEKLIKQ